LSQPRQDDNFSEDDAPVEVVLAAGGDVTALAGAIDVAELRNQCQTLSLRGTDDDDDDDDGDDDTDESDSETSSIASNDLEWEKGGGLDILEEMSDSSDEDPGKQQQQQQQQRLTAGTAHAPNSASLAPWPQTNAQVRGY
jgi:hypothetical protein